MILKFGRVGGSILLYISRSIFFCLSLLGTRIFSLACRYSLPYSRPPPCFQFNIFYSICLRTGYRSVSERFVGKPRFGISETTQIAGVDRSLIRFTDSDLSCAFGDLCFHVSHELVDSIPHQHYRVLLVQHLL